MWPPRQTQGKASKRCVVHFTLLRDEAQLLLCEQIAEGVAWISEQVLRGSRSDTKVETQDGRRRCHVSPKVTK